MDTKQKPRTAQNSGRTGVKRKKKTAGLFGIGGKKKPAKRPAAAGNSQKTMTAEEAARRREILAKKRAQEQAAQAAARQAAVAQQEPVDESIPEVVYKPTEEEREGLTPEEAKRAEMRNRSAKRTKDRKAEAKRNSKRPNVTYTDPVPFNLRKLLLQLAVVTAVVLAIVMGLSVFFRVDRVVVYGNDAYSAWTIQEASGIESGENLLTFGSTRACGKIITALPYVKTARIGIKLPDTVNIYIEEFDVVYAISNSEGEWWLMTSGGKIVEKIDSGIANSYTKVIGVEVESPVIGAQAKAVENLIPVTQETDTSGEPVSTEPVFTITGADRLKAALMILDALELNDIVGEAASINVQSLNNLELMYGTRYQVKLGDSNNMEYKIATMKQAVAQLNEYQTGILDCSFTTWTDRPGYTPYE